MTTETKPGFLTTEFWVLVFVQGAAFVELIADPFNVPNKYVILAQAISASVYALSRGIAKAGQPYFPPRDPDLEALADELATDAAAPPEALQAKGGPRATKKR